MKSGIYALIDSLIIQLLENHDDLEYGVPIDYIITYIGNLHSLFSNNRIYDSLSRLCFNGYIYSTVDDSMYKCAF